MSDTIELMEAIGQNASLRHASEEELTRTLEQANASEAFKAAATSGDSSPLSAELGQKPLHVTHHSQWPGHEEDEPDHDDDDDSAPPHKPDDGKPSPHR